MTLSTASLHFHACPRIRKKSSVHFIRETLLGVKRDDVSSVTANAVVNFHGRMKWKSRARLDHRRLISRLRTAPAFEFHSRLSLYSNIIDLCHEKPRRGFLSLATGRLSSGATFLVINAEYYARTSIRRL
jgi:hypothetical protein